MEREAGRLRDIPEALLLCAISHATLSQGVILSGASRGLIARGAVEGSAFLFYPKGLGCNL
ncbi:hypothetical protein [Edaphobacter modestus]|uniref:Uncharacterized protein n=1 Tax=Edaphobacter modestus TaxID=388466 RepID=A0A4Q7Z1G5_9BACT|nr:hypothetical protein [Edaphobacter modestus]RZU43383.1 hypothetical protein BDD14_5042 [Edaphobacter modestus]